MNNGAHSNYEIHRENARKLFLGYDIEKIKDKFGLENDEAYLYLTYIGSRFRLNRENAVLEVEDRATGEYLLSDYNDALVLYDLLANSEDGAKPSGDLVQIQNLSRVQNASSYAGEGIYERYGKEYSGREEELLRACKALGGEPYGKGDVAMKIPFFQGIYFAISFWEADDEFPPVLNIYMDSNILHFIRYETAWYAAGGLMNHIASICRDNKGS